MRKSAPSRKKNDLILDVVHLHEKHLHHVEEKLEQTNKLLADLLEANVWFSSKVTDAIKKKFESVVWHPATNDFTLILHVPMVANSNLLNLYEFLPLPIHFDFTANISITLDVGQTNLLTIGHSQSFQAISSTDLNACLHLGDTFFCKGRKVMETNLKRSCLGALYMANSNSIQNHCRFKIAEAREKIFELSENTWAVYSIGTISTNQVCPAANDVTAMQIQSGDMIKIKPGC